MALHDNLRKCRIEAGLTQEQVGDEFDISKQAVSNWEHKNPAKRTRPSEAQIEKFAKLVNKPISLIVEDSTEVAEGWAVTEKSDSGLIELLNTYAALSDSDKALLLGMAKRLAN